MPVVVPSTTKAWTTSVSGVGWDEGKKLPNIEAIKKAWRGTKEHIYFKMCGTGLKAVGSNVEINIKE